jgi:hypothetical protein
VQVTGWLAWRWPESRRRRPLAPVAEIARRLFLRLSRTGDAVSVSPVSTEWLAEHEVVSSKHSDEVSTS